MNNKPILSTDIAPEDYGQQIPTLPIQFGQRSQVDITDVLNKDGTYITADIFGDSAQTAANYGIIFIVRYPIEVMRVAERHEVAGSDAGAVTLDVLKVPDGSAISAGTSILSSTFDLKSTADTVVNKQARDLASNRKFKENYAIGLQTSGVLTDVAGVHITLYIIRAGNGTYR